METSMLGDQLGVAVLALLGSLLVRKLQIPKRLDPLVPMVLAVLIVWAVGPPSVWEVLKNGAVSGLLAGGMLYILLGFGPKQSS